MKKYIILQACCWILAVSAHSQVFINTQSGNGIFYIDAAGDNSGASATRFRNDVMVDSSGSLVLGQAAAPTMGKAKLDITSADPYGALHFQDGNEAEGMVLFGNKDGYASWGMMKGSGGYMENVVAPAGNIVTKTPVPLWFTSTRNYIPILDDGNYLIMIRTSITYTGTPIRISGYLYLCKGSSDPTTSAIDTYESHVQVINGKKISIYTVLRAINVKEDDKLYVVAMPQTTGCTWKLDLAYTQVFVYRV